MAALGNQRLGLLDNWIRHIRDVRAAHAKDLDSISNIQDRANCLAEFKFCF